MRAVSIPLFLFGDKDRWIPSVSLTVHLTPVNRGDVRCRAVVMISGIVNNRPLLAWHARFLLKTAWYPVIKVPPMGLIGIMNMVVVL